MHVISKNIHCKTSLFWQSNFKELMELSQSCDETSNRQLFGMMPDLIEIGVSGAWKIHRL